MSKVSLQQLWSVPQHALIHALGKRAKECKKCPIKMRLALASVYYNTDMLVKSDRQWVEHSLFRTAMRSSLDQGKQAMCLPVARYVWLLMSVSVDVFTHTSSTVIHFKDRLLAMRCVEAKCDNDCGTDCDNHPTCDIEDNITKLISYVEDRDGTSIHDIVHDAKEQTLVSFYDKGSHKPDDEHPPPCDCLSEDDADVMITQTWKTFLRRMPQYVANIDKQTIKLESFCNIKMFNTMVEHDISLYVPVAQYFYLAVLWQIAGIISHVNPVYRTSVVKLIDKYECAFIFFPDTDSTTVSFDTMMSRIVA